MLHILAVYVANFLAGGHFLNVQKLLLLNSEKAVNIFENGSIQNRHNLMLYVKIGVTFTASLNH